MSILMIMVPATALLAIEDMVRTSYNKISEIANNIHYKIKIRERRSRSQHRWA